MLKVFFIGSGKLNQNFANALSKTDVEMIGVYSATEANSFAFSKKFKTPQFLEFTSIPTDCDVYFLGVNDSQIKTVSDKIKVSGIVVHCSGMMNLDVLNKHKNHGIFWPIQSLSKDYYTSFLEVPICIEASDENSLRILESLADKISKKLLFVDANQRKILHLSAVFANNFTNHLFVLSKDFLANFNLDFDLLKPIIQETFNKIQYIDPHLAQTGPASRNDTNTMNQHEVILENSPDLLNVYKTLSKSISQHHKQ